jgi:hypothetical protein
MAEISSLTPPDSPLTEQDVEASAEYQDLMTPDVQPGDVAPEFTLPQLDFSEGTGRTTGRSVRLSDYAGAQPVALIFGSYT